MPSSVLSFDSSPNLCSPSDQGRVEYHVADDEDDTNAVLNDDLEPMDTPTSRATSSTVMTNVPRIVGTRRALPLSQNVSEPSYGFKNVTKDGGNIREYFTEEQIRGTTLYVRIDETSVGKVMEAEIYRFISLKSISSQQDVFTACERIWVDKLGTRVPRLLAYLPTKLGGLTEFVTSQPGDIQEFLRLMKAEWNGASSGTDLIVKVVLMV